MPASQWTAVLMAAPGPVGQAGFYPQSTRGLRRQKATQRPRVGRRQLRGPGWVTALPREGGPALLSIPVSFRRQAGPVASSEDHLNQQQDFELDGLPRFLIPLI